MRERANAYENFQEETILSQFKSSNWDRIKKDNRLFFFQQLENLHAKREQRDFCEVIPTQDSSIKFMDFGFCRNQRKILVRESLLYDGIVTNFQNGQKKKIPFLNLYLPDCFFHEQWHISTFFTFLNHQELFREDKEYLLWVYAMETCDLGKILQRYLEENKYYLYRIMPDEYYAHIYAYQKVKKYFSKDPNFLLYQKYYLEMIRFAEKSYEENQGKVLSLKDIYFKSLIHYLDTACSKENWDSSMIMGDILNTQRKLTLPIQDV